MKDIGWNNFIHICFYHRVSTILIYKQDDKQIRVEKIHYFKWKQ